MYVHCTVRLGELLRPHRLLLSAWALHEWLPMCGCQQTTHNKKRAQTIATFYYDHAQLNRRANATQLRIVNNTEYGCFGWRTSDQLLDIVAGIFAMPKTSMCVRNPIILHQTNCVRNSDVIPRFISCRCHRCGGDLVACSMYSEGTYSSVHPNVLWMHQRRAAPRLCRYMPANSNTHNSEQCIEHNINRIVFVRHTDANIRRT